MPKIVMNSKDCIHVTGRSKSFYYGYSMVNEKFVQMHVYQCIEVTHETLSIMADTLMKAYIADKICKSGAEAAQKLNITPRTFFRHRKKYYDNRCESSTK